MSFLLAEYSSRTRVELALQMLYAKEHAILVPVTGSLVLSSGSVSVTSEDSAALAVTTVSSATIFVCKGTKTAATPGGISADEVMQRRDNIYHQLALLCKAKFDFSKNPFTLECASDRCTLLISAGVESDSLTYTIKSSVGDAIIANDVPVRELTAECKGIKSFAFRMTNESCEKDIRVRRGQLEIFREISHYLNRTLVFYRLNEKCDVVSTLCVANNGCCELRKDRANSFKFFKVPFTKVAIPVDGSLCAVDLSIDKIIGKAGIPSLFGGGASNCLR